MQLFLRAQNTHTLEVTGQETVGQIKVKCSKVGESTELFGSQSGHNFNTALFSVIYVNLNDLENVAQIKTLFFFGVSQAHVQGLEGLLVEDQVLLLAGCPLEDDACLASCGVSEHCTLEVAGRLLGGQYTAATHHLMCLYFSGK